MRRSYVRYSEAFKRQVVAEIEDGKFSSIGEANQEIYDFQTVMSWLVVTRLRRLDRL